MHHTADDMRGRDGRFNLACGVYRREPCAGIRAAKALQKPPRHAVHGGQHNRLRADERRDVPGNISERRCLDSDHNQVLRAQLGG